MSDWFPLCPAPPSWEIDWRSIRDAFAWIDELVGCPQDPLHHAEGDVWTHTRIACEVLTALPSFRGRVPEECAILFAAVLLHDVGKPACTRHEPDGRITARGHARRGAIRARSILWRLGVPIGAREQVTALIRRHQVPFFLLERSDSRRVAIEASQTARCDLLALVAEADARGRECADTQRLLDNIALFVEYCREQSCLDQPYAFPSDHARFLYFRRPDRDPTYAAYDDTRCEAGSCRAFPAPARTTGSASTATIGPPSPWMPCAPSLISAPPTNRVQSSSERARSREPTFVEDRTSSGTPPTSAVTCALAASTCSPTTEPVCASSTSKPPSRAFVSKTGADPIRSPTP